MGYHGRFGQNTFSLFDEDLGLSSYLESRMCKNIPYKGFGISAQSLSDKGLSYNILKGVRQAHLPAYEEITEADIYRLPADERAAKFVSISLYSGQIDLTVLSDIVQEDAHTFYDEQFTFLAKHGLAKEEGDSLYLTEDGVRLSGGIAALFWSPYHAERFLAANKSRG